jgi:hypothetical protein
VPRFLMEAAPQRHRDLEDLTQLRLLSHALLLDFFVFCLVSFGRLISSVSDPGSDRTAKNELLLIGFNIIKFQNLLCFLHQVRFSYYRYSFKDGNMKSRKNKKFNLQ